jgi:CelD/BcsL family acetyltransferase involved in cellulose biosynthesis
LNHWYHTVGSADGVEPVIIIVYEKDEPIALFPFCLHRIFGIRVIKFLGGMQSDYNAPIFLPERFTRQGFLEIWSAMLEFLPAHDVRYFTRMPEYLDANENLHFFVFADMKIDGVSYSARLSASWQNYERHLSRKLLKDNSRMIRRLSEIGELYILDSKSENQYQRIIEITILQKTQRYLETGVRNILSSGAVRQFYTGLHAAITGEPKVHLTALKIDDMILATHLGVYDRGRYYYLFPTFDSGTFSKYSPGRLLLEHLMKSAIEKGLNVFDFTVGGEAYKKKWCDSEMLLYRIQEANTLQGQFYICSLSLISWLKQCQYLRRLMLGGMRLFRKCSGQYEK